MPPELDLAPAGPRDRAQRNLAALRTLRQLELEGRWPTDDERQTLVRYSGWGALPRVFERFPGEWRDVAEALRALVDDAEWESLRASTPNAHYTSPAIVEAMWTAVQRLGIRDTPRVLEPALGIGHFFGLQPAALDGPRTGIELDHVSVRLARLLYPDSAIRQGAFQAQPRMGGYDLVISNVPFGNYGVVDQHYGRHSLVTRSIHDYFIGRALDEVRPGGVVAVVTSRYTLDKINASFRQWAAARAGLLGALRLPSSAFLGNAGTQVVTDIVFLQRHFTGGPRGVAWQDTRAFEESSLIARVNGYFFDHPEQVLGRMTFGRGLHGREELIVEGELTRATLTAAVERLPADVVPGRDDAQRPRVTLNLTPAGRAVHVDAEAPVPPEHSQAIATPAGVKVGAYHVVEERLYISEGLLSVPADLKGRATERVRGLVGVRERAITLVRSQIDGTADEAVSQARAALNRAYDAFVERFGPLRSSANAAAFAEDPDAALLLSLEDSYDREANTARKAAIFTRRTAEPYQPPSKAETAVEALTISLSETGRVSWPRLTELTGRSAPELIGELGDLVFDDPATGEWVTRDAYLSGPVRHKLAQARAAAEGDPAFERHVAALAAVQPRDLMPDEIKVALGAAWIPVEDIQAFANHLVPPAGHAAVVVLHSAATASWVVETNWRVTQGLASLHTWGTARAPAMRLLEDALNQRVSTITDFDPVSERDVPNLAETLAAREKQQAQRDEFARWVWSDPERTERLTRRYNETFNAHRCRVFDGSHLHLPDIHRAVLRDGDLARHQKDGVWRQLQQRATLLALPVGAGKTYTMIAAAQEGRRLGLVRKSLFVVPTSLVDQWASEFYRLYPTARVLVGSREHLAARDRQRFLARCATSDYDAVIVAHSSFGKLALRPESQAELLQHELLRLEEALDGARDADMGPARRSLVKQIEKAKRRLEVRIEHLNARPKDPGLTFEELGFDALFVDEAHAFKNLMLTTKMSRVAGLPTGESERAWDMYAKVRQVLRSQGRVVFATGTPVTNTLAEVYTLQRFLQEDVLEDLGIAHFDAWAATFAQAVTSVELAPDGSGYRSATRFAAFNNVPELALLLSQVADVRHETELHLERPALAGGAPQVVVVPGAPELSDFMSTISARAERIRTRMVHPATDNMLKVTGDGRRAALDLREVGLPAADPESQKVAVIAARVASIWEATQEGRATQVVFCDISTPGARSDGSFCFYDALRTALVAHGVPEHEVRFIHEAEGDAQKLELFQALNRGDVRVVLGSTEKLGTGANFQQRLIAAHHADAPWRPADVEQRNGRILRPGNSHAEVQVYYYVTSASFDAYMWQGLQRKQEFIDQLLRGNLIQRSIEDVGASAALTAAEAKALATGNPAILEVVRLETRIRELAALEEHHHNTALRMAGDIRSTDLEIARASSRAHRLSEDLTAVQVASARAGDGGAGVVLGGVVYRGEGHRKTAAAALEQALQPLRRACVMRNGAPVTAEIGSCLGLALHANTRRTLDELGALDTALLTTVWLQGQERYDVSYQPGAPEGCIASIEAQAHPRHIEQMATTQAADVVRLRALLDGLRAEVNKPFVEAGRLAELRQEHAALVDALQLREQEPAPVVLDAPESALAPMELER